MFGNLDISEIKSNFSFENLSSLIKQENDSNSINSIPMNITHISESNNSFDNLYFQKNEEYKMNTLKNKIRKIKKKI